VGHNVRQPQYAAAPLLQWMLSGDQKYLDAASELMDYKHGLNPLGISYVTGLGFHQIRNVHDRESAYTISRARVPNPASRFSARDPGMEPQYRRHTSRNRFGKGAPVCG